MGTRKAALAGLGVSFALFVLTAIIIPAPSSKNTEGKAPAPTASPTGKKADDPTEGQPATASQKAAAIKFYKSVFAGLKGCDVAARETANVAERMQAGTASVYDGYNSATAQVAACRASSSDVRSIDVSDELSPVGREAAEKAQNTCSNMAVAKLMAGETAQEVFDGNMKPSKIQEMRERAETAQAGVMACALDAMAVALKSGIEPKDVPKVD